MLNSKGVNMFTTEKTGYGTAHGKIILVGEHAVVYNEPAIAIPFTSATVEVTIRKITGDSTIDSIYHSGKLADAPKSVNNLIRTLNAVCLYLGRSPDHLAIQIDSNIPAERGMGSSAAVATALVRALFNYFNEELTDKLLYRFVSISEKIAHGNPSGLDATVVSSDLAVYFKRSEATSFFDNRMPAYLIIADTGKTGETIEAVTDVGQLVADKNTDGKKIVTELGRFTKDARKLIENKKVKELGKMLTEAQSRLKKLTVSDQKLDHLIDVALENNALGAKLTGGGRGGCMIALTDQLEGAEKIASALLDAGAVQTWIHYLGD